MQSSRVSTEFGEGPVFGSRQFEPEEQNAIQATLQSLPSPPTQQLGTSDKDRGHTIESKIDLANELFHFNGWSDRIMSLNVDYSEQELSLWCVGVTAIVRVTLKDGSYHENVGFAESRNENKGVAIQEAKMKAVMNARQQSLRLFGIYFSALYASDKDNANEDLVSTISSDSRKSSLQRVDSENPKSPEPQEETNPKLPPLTKPVEITVSSTSGVNVAKVVQTKPDGHEVSQGSDMFSQIDFDGIDFEMDSMVGQVQQGGAPVQDVKQKSDSDRTAPAMSKPNPATASSPQANRPSAMASPQANRPQAVSSPQSNHPPAVPSPQPNRPPMVPTPQANRSAPHSVNRPSPQVHPPMPPHNPNMLPGGIVRGPNGQPMIRTPPSAIGQSAVYVQPAQNNAFSVKRTVPFIS
ncbi:hypothetical protein WA588_001864 [Blastocystis sp. NMH]